MTSEFEAYIRNRRCKACGVRVQPGVGYCNACKRFEDASHAKSLDRERIRGLVVGALGGRLDRVCSVELAAMAGCPIGRAKGILVQLEKEGRLSSTHEPAPRTGNGRRYYRLQTAEAS